MNKIPKCQWARKTPLYLKKGDKHYNKHAHQLKTRGFSDSETWDLTSVITDFVLPRLTRFKELDTSFPAHMTMEQWNATIDEMIFAFTWSRDHKDSKNTALNEKKKRASWARYERGMQLFANYFQDLWS